MKTIIYNYDNLEEGDINRYIHRAKALITNSNDEILTCYSNNNYHLPGGHLENSETYLECLIREVKEEAGIDISNNKSQLFMQIIYMNKNYPKQGINTKSIANYYYVNTDIVPNIDNTNLTEEEKESNFELKYINKNEIINVLENSLKDSTRYGVTKDTMDVIEEFLNPSIGCYFYKK